MGDRRLHLFVTPLVGVTLLLGLLAAPVLADPRLIELLEPRYEVLELSSGYALEPLPGGEGDFRLIEITGGQILIDGDAITADQLSRWVGDDAETILQLAGLEPSATLAEDPASEDPASEDSDSEAQSVDDDLDARTDGETAADERRQKRRDRRGGQNTQVSYGSKLVVEEGETVDEVVLIGGPLEVDGTIEGDAVVIMGSARVSGRIDGSLTVLGGAVTLESEAFVDGDLVAIGGPVRRDSGATVTGEVVQVAAGELFNSDGDGDIDIDVGDWDFGGDSVPGLDLLGRIFKSAAVLLLIFGAYFLAPARIHAIADRARLEPWKAGLVGFAVELIFLPLLGLVSLVLLISIVGIPLLAVVPPLLALLLFVLLIMGFASVTHDVGSSTSGRFNLANASPYMLMLVGLLLIDGWSILGEVFDFVPWPISMAGWLLIIFGFVLKYIAWTVGLGAAVLHQFSPLDGTPRFFASPRPPLPPEGSVGPYPDPYSGSQVSGSQASGAQVSGDTVRGGEASDIQVASRLVEQAGPMMTEPPHPHDVRPGDPPGSDATIRREHDGD